MLKPTLLSLVLSLVTIFAAAAAVEEKKCPRPCSSSSSSSSSSEDCNACGKPSCCPEASVKAASYLQARWISFIRACDYTNAKFLMSPGFSSSVIDLLCPANRELSCVNSRGANLFLDQYFCGWRYDFIGPTVDNIAIAKNGTVTISLMQQEIRDSPGPLRMYYYNFHWNPTFDCNFELAYVDGHNYKSPDFRKNMISCSQCLPQE